MRTSIATSAFLATLVAASPGRPAASSIASSATCNGKSYQYLGLAGYGFTPSNSRDKFGDTAGGIGSSAAFKTDSWILQSNGSYTGLLYALPDRGW